MPEPLAPTCAGISVRIVAMNTDNDKTDGKAGLSSDHKHDREKLGAALAHAISVVARISGVPASAVGVI